MNKDYVATALVPMKDYSERIPSKNMRMLGEKRLADSRR